MENTPLEVAEAPKQLPEAALAAISPPIPWLPIGWVALVLALSFLPMLERLGQQLMNDDDMGHGFFVPIVSLYIAWMRKEEILALDLKRSYLGLAVMLWGAIQFILGTIAAELFLTRTSIIFTLTGIVIFIGGSKLLRILAFPLFLLVFMVPLPAVIYNKITFPLQLFASGVAEVGLLTIGIPVLRDGNILELSDGHRLSVVEACSGIRSLLTLTFLSLVYGFFFESRNWLRAVLLFSTIPIAIAANAFRVTLTGVINEYKREWAEGFFHSAEGWVIFMFALSMLLGLHRFILWFIKGIQNAKQQAESATPS